MQKGKAVKGRWYLGTTKTVGSQREVYICDSLFKVLLDFKNLQDNYEIQYGNNYKKYILDEVKNKYGKLVEYKIVESNSKYNRINMVFTRKNGKYSGTDIVKYPFKIIHHELGIKCRFYDLRGSFATISLRNGCEIKDIAEVLGHKRIETTEKYYISSAEKDKMNVIINFDKKHKDI